MAHALFPSFLECPPHLASFSSSDESQGKCTAYCKPGVNA